MRKVYTLLSAVIMIVITISCDKDEALTDNPRFVDTSAPPSFSAKVDDVSFTGERFLSVFSNGTASVSGFDGAGKELTITVDVQREGIFKIRIADHLLKYWPDNSTQNLNTLYTSDVDQGEIGTIEILKISDDTTTISGIFNGRVVLSPLSSLPSDTIMITDGSFTNIPISRF